jgi:hypothetical protein
MVLLSPFLSKQKIIQGHIFNVRQLLVFIVIFTVKGYGVNATFNNISVLLVEETRVPEKTT